MYGTGTGTRQDLAGAQRLFTKACAGGEEQGCTDATAVAPFAPASK
jgi:TPR repeat protein